MVIYMKQQRQKQIVLTVLTAGILTSGLLTSCTSNKGTLPPDTSAGDSNTAALTETGAEDNRLPAPAVKDMNGAELTILNATADSFNWATTTILVEEAVGETLNDALFKREQWVEETYHCSISEMQQPNGELVSYIPKSVSAGDKTFDAAMVFDASVSTILLKDCLLSWDEVPNLDLTTPWWDNAATQEYNFGGIQAAVSGAYSLYNYSTRHVYVFNNKMMTDLDVDEDLYRLVREGAWTVDKLYEIASLAVSDLNGDGKMEEETDRYGIIGTPTRHYSALLMGSGVKYIDRSEDGTLYFAIPGNAHAQSVMEKFVQLDTQNTDIYTDKKADINIDIDTVFTEGRAMFCAAYVGEAAKMRSLEFDIGFVPPPKFDREQSEYYSLVEGGAQTVLPRILDDTDLEKVGVLLNALGYASYYESIPAYIEVLLKEKVARNEDSAEMLQLVFDSSAYDLGTGVWSADTKNKYVSNIFAKSSPDIASLTQKYTQAVEKQLAKFETALADLS